MISYSVSLGDLVVAALAILSIIVNWMTVQKRIEILETQYSELRRGRGLIIDDGDWPDAVKRCFGRRA